VVERRCLSNGSTLLSKNKMMSSFYLQYLFPNYSHDVECRRGAFQGKAIVLPSEIRLSIEDYFFDVALANFDEEAVIAEAERNKLEEQEFEKALLKLDISG